MLKSEFFRKFMNLCKKKEKIDPNFTYLKKKNFLDYTGEEDKLIKYKIFFNQFRGIFLLY